MDQMKDVLKEEFKKEMLNEYPNPYFYHGKDGEGFFKEVKNWYPRASYHKITGMGEIICIDAYSRMMLSVMLLGASKAKCYSAWLAKKDEFALQAEAVHLIDLCEAESRGA